MSRLTFPPNFIGTIGIDTLIGEELNASLGIGIDILTGGFDTLDLSAFNRSEITISGVICGNALNPAIIAFNNNGNAIALSTTEFENFIFADGSFSYSALI